PSAKRSVPVAQKDAPKLKSLPPVTVAPTNHGLNDKASQAKQPTPSMIIASDSPKPSEVMIFTSNRPSSGHPMCVDNPSDDKSEGDYEDVDYYVLGAPAKDLYQIGLTLK
ncbi:hypothetical protein L0F63_007005, partial [Massospora cicadina]